MPDIVNNTFSYEEDILDESLSEDNKVSSVFNFLLYCLEEKNFELMDTIFSKVDPSKCSIVVMLAPLSISCLVKRFLPSRAEYYAKVQDELVNRGETPLRVTALLQGLD